MSKRLSIKLIALLAFQPWSLAALAQEQPVLATGQSPFGAGAVFQLLLGLVFVVGLIFLLAWFAKKNLSLPNVQGQFKVIATLPVSYREKLIIVQVGGEQLLLGVSPGRITKLHTLDEPFSEAKLNDGVFASKLVQALQARQGKDS